MKPLFEGAKRLLIRNLTVKNDSTPKLKGPIYVKKTTTLFLCSPTIICIFVLKCEKSICFIISESHPDGTLYTLWFHRSYSPTLFSTPSNQGSIKHVCRSTENQGLNTIFFQRSVLFCFLFFFFFLKIDFSRHSFVSCTLAQFLSTRSLAASYQTRQSLT